VENVVQPVTVGVVRGVGERVASLRALAVDFGRMVYTRPVGYFLDEDDDADPGNHTVQVVARRLGGMSRDDLPKVADYVEMVEVRARLQNRG
jgi:hypothetical protein